MRSHVRVIENHVTVEMPAPPEKVFPWLVEPALLQQWTGGLRDMRALTPGPTRQGSKFSQRLDVAGRSIDADVVITSYEPPRRVATRMTSADFDVDAEASLSAVPGGTKIDFRSDTNLRSFTLRLLQGMIRGAAQQHLEQGFARLRRLLV